MQLPESMLGTGTGSEEQKQAILRRIHPSKSELTELYDSTAGYWDSSVQRGVYGHAYANLLELLIPQLRPASSELPIKVLDCGTGCGLMLTSLLKVMGSRSMKLIGVDLAPQMLERARRRLSAQAADVALCRADIAALPFRDNEMDLVMSALTLEYASDPVSVLREMMRVARSNAKLLLVTTRAYAPDLPYQIVFRYKHFESDQVPHWMEEAGVQNVIRQPLAGIARWFGQAYVGRKAK